MNGSGNQRVRGLAQRAAAFLTGSLLSVQALAFQTGHLQATEPLAAALELAGILGYEDPGDCELIAPANLVQLVPQQPFKVRCGQAKVVFKYHERAATRDSRALWKWLGQQLPPEQLAMIRKPYGEFSFHWDQHGMGYYTVYPWVAGRGLVQWTTGMAWLVNTARSTERQQRERARVQKVYQQLDSLFGNKDRIRLIGGGMEPALRQARSAAPGPYALSVTVTPSDELVVDLDAIEPADATEPSGWKPFDWSQQGVRLPDWVHELETAVGCAQSEALPEFIEGTLWGLYVEPFQCFVFVMTGIILDMPTNVVCFFTAVARGLGMLELLESDEAPLLQEMCRWPRARQP